MPPAHTNLPSHRRAFSSSKSLVSSTGKITLSSRSQSHPKLSALGKKRTTGIVLKSTATPAADTGEFYDEMTFLQYCSTCDKQILVPSSQLLYCSESCRRKDSLSTTPPPQLNLVLRSAAMSTSPTSSVPKMLSEINRFEESQMDMPTRSMLSMASTSPPGTTSKPPVLHSFKPDLDPTEWKPNLTTSPTTTNPVSVFHPSPVIPNASPKKAMTMKEGVKSETTVPTIHEKEEAKPDFRRSQSVAFGYLAQFHRSANSFLSLAGKRPSLTSRRSTSSVSIPDALAAVVSDPETPAMSLDRSSSYSSAASSGISIAIHAPDVHAVQDLSAEDGQTTEDALLDGGLVFGKARPDTVLTGS